MPAAPERRATVLTVLNLKGGVGKTHVVWLLAGVSQERQRRILLIDTDTQGNLTNSFVRQASPRPGVERLLDPSSEPDVRSLIRRTAWSSIDIIPASPAVIPFDLSDQRDWEKADLHRSFVDPVRELSSLYDFIVFDCPPRLSLVSFAALVASHHLITPLEAADWGAQGIKYVTEALDYVRDRFNPDLSLLGYIISRYKPRRSYQYTYEQQMRAHFGKLVFDTVLPDLATFERAVTDAVPITEHARRSRAAAIARSLFDEVCRRSRPAEQESRRLVRLEPAKAEGTAVRERPVVRSGA